MPIITLNSDNIVKLTPEHEKLWMETRAGVLWAQPAFGDIWYKMMVDKKGNTAYFINHSTIHTAATDERYMFINPKGFFHRPLQHRIFICCHEILHAIFNHCGLMHRLAKAGKVTFKDGTSLPYRDHCMQMAMDYVINDILAASNVGDVPPDALHNSKFIKGTDELYEAYRKVFRSNPPAQKPDGTGNSGSGGGFDYHLAPGTGDGKDPDEAQAERSDTEWKNAIAGAVAAAKAMGKLPLGIERLLSEVLEPEIDWAEKLATALNRRIGKDGATWENLDTDLIIRGIGAPGRRSYGAGTIRVAVDTSGSIDQTMMDRFMGEVSGILDNAHPERLILLQCDAAIHECVECQDTQDLYQRKILGGGGTSFVPVFDRIEEDGGPTDVLIYFTDGYGTFPKSAPNYPVIWATVGIDEYPWGDVIQVPLRKNGKEV